MGIKSENFKPYESMSLEEMDIVHSSGIYPFMPIISEPDWQTLKNYILELAPDSLPPIAYPNEIKKQSQFDAATFAIDEDPGSYFTFL